MRPAMPLLVAKDKDRLMRALRRWLRRVSDESHELRTANLVVDSSGAMFAWAVGCGLITSNTLMLRLRAGVGARADLLAFLLGLTATPREHAPRASVEVIATATAYSVASFRRAATEMVMAGLLTESTIGRRSSR